VAPDSETPADVFPLTTTTPPAEEAAPPVDEPRPPVEERAAPAAGVAFWPRFHGADGTNISPDTGLLKQWPSGGPSLVWQTAGIGHGYSSVTLAEGLIFTDGNLDGQTMVTALNPDGDIVWQRANGPAWTKSYEGTRGTPTYDAGNLYHESPLGNVACLRAKTGEKVWEVNILDKFGGKNIQWALAESVLVDGDRVICCPGGQQASVVALDKKTGETVWAARGTGDLAGYATPVLTEYQGVRMILTMNAKALIGVNADSGELLFRHGHETQYDVNATMPIFHDGHVFISSGYGSGSELLKLSVSGGRVAVEPAWKSDELDNHHGGVILLNGYLYGAAHNRNRGKWICLDWQTGQMRYAEAGVGKGSATCADGMLYTMSENRDVGLVPATPQGHTVVSQFKLPSGGEGRSWAHPVVCGGRLYLRHSDVLYAYDVRATP
jgi:outer membrane protein assembly factor BamB